MEAFRKNILQFVLIRQRLLCFTPLPVSKFSTCNRRPEGGRQKGGNRPLTDPSKVFAFNNWDNVVWDEEQEEEARKITEKHACTPLPPQRKDELEEKADSHWDDFYKQHKNRFFKDRHWLFTEFPELNLNSKVCESNAASQLPSEGCSTDSLDVKTTIDHSDYSENFKSLKIESKQSSETVSEKNLRVSTDICDRDKIDSCENSRQQEVDFPGSTSSFRIMEVGCGVGNTVFPVLQTNNDPGLMIYCCDFSSTAVQLVKSHPDYDSQRCHAFVFDVSDEKLSFPFPECSLDLVILIFVLSSINPEKMQFVLNRLCKCLKPGGKILFRDYGRYDMAQLRFKKDRCLSENFYVRGDGTRVYFFTQDDLKEMFERAGMTELENAIDRRLQVNRGKQLKMYRVWIQCKYQKPLELI